MFKKSILIIISTLLISSSLFAGVEENAAKVKVATLYEKGKKSNIVFSMSYFKAYGGGIEQMVGTLNYNIQNYQLPAGTIKVNDNWASIFLKISAYINSAKSQEEYYFRVYQFVSSSFNNLAASTIYTDVFIEEASSTNDIVANVFNLLRSSKKDFYKKGVLNIILFSSMVDLSSNDAFAKKHFKKIGLTKNWNKMKKELKL